jgi:hypothetical protein
VQRNDLGDKNVVAIGREAGRHRGDKALVDGSTTINQASKEGQETEPKFAPCTRNEGAQEFIWLTSECKMAMIDMIWPSGWNACEGGGG